LSRKCRRFKAGFSKWEWCSIAKDSEAYEIKKDIRTVGFDDGCYFPGLESVLLVGAVLRGNSRLEAVMSCQVKKDGFDSTEKMACLVNNSRQKPQIRAIFLDGLSFAGFNIPDIIELSKMTKLPAIAVIRKPPDMDAVKDAVKRLSGSEKRLEAMASAGKVHAAKTGDSEIFFQCAGVSLSNARVYLKRTILHANVPEPVRVAHLIASGISRGDSRGRV